MTLRRVDITCLQVSPSSKKPTLRLIYSAEKPVVEFGKIQLSEEKTRELLVVNPEKYDRNSVIEGVPERKGFTVFCVSIWLVNCQLFTTHKRCAKPIDSY